MKKDKINCIDCIHYFITWDDKFPRGCRIMDFKSREMPSVAVHRASGIPCLRFRDKKQK
ncbi:MAG TPA: uracil-DNA glycosylase [Nitrospiraceae bacterium]|nr:uracil-DNA glycosylase [Nitrospiraceae bacterium]